jgi:DNA helicase-2/ATP-dependent DNA helicase PcrA
MNGNNMKPIEIEEKKRLENCLVCVQNNIWDIGARLDDYAREIRERKEYMWEARRDMDHLEKVALRQ